MSSRHPNEERQLSRVDFLYVIIASALVPLAAMFIQSALIYCFQGYRLYQAQLWDPSHPVLEVLLAGETAITLIILLFLRRVLKTASHRRTAFTLLLIFWTWVAFFTGKAPVK